MNKITYTNKINGNGTLLGTCAFVVGSICTIYIGCSYWHINNIEKANRIRNRIKNVGLRTRDTLNSFIPRNVEINRLIYGMIGIKLVVFYMWHLPRFSLFMHKHFLDLPSSSRYYTMITSLFSHQTVPHLLFNCMAFYSFSAAVCQILGNEQFLAFYLSAGIFSSALNRFGYFLKPSFFKNIPSLGASGAVFGLFSFVAMSNPGSTVSLIFLPFIPFKIGHMLYAMVIFDLFGLFRRFSNLGHLVNIFS